MIIPLVADIQNRLFWRAGTGRVLIAAFPPQDGPRLSWRRLKPTVLRALLRKAVTSANVAVVPALRTYLTYDECRHHRVSGPCRTDPRTRCQSCNGPNWAGMRFPWLQAWPRCQLRNLCDPDCCAA
jgi:hypothetical protein